MGIYILKRNFFLSIVILTNIIVVSGCTPPIYSDQENALRDNSPRIAGISLTSDSNVLSLQVKTNDSTLIDFQVDLLSLTALSKNENFAVSSQYSPNVTIPNIGENIEVWGMRDIEENDTIIVIIIEKEVKGNYTIPNRFFQFVNETTLTRIEDFSSNEEHNMIYYSEVLDTVFVPTWPTFNASSDLIFESYYSFELDGSNSHHAILSIPGILSITEMASKSFPSPYSRFYDNEGLIYHFYGATGSCYSGSIIHYSKTSIKILHDLPYGHQRDLFDIRTKEHIRWYNSYDYDKLIFEGVKIIKSSYINNSITEYLVPYDVYPTISIEVDSFSELIAPWIYIFISTSLLLLIKRKRKKRSI